MKGSRNQNNMQNKQNQVNRPTPEIRDNLDSRERKEAGYKKEKDDTNKSEKKRFDKNDE